MAKKIESEAKTRQSILKQAMQFYGPEGARQVQMHFDKYDKLLKQCDNENERKHLELLAITELHTMMGIRSGLEINGKEVIPPKE